MSTSSSIFSHIKCTPDGACYRDDNILLYPGIQPITKILFTTKANSYPYTNTTIISYNPFENAASLSYIKGSTQYVCADGFAECFLSCCSNGFCTQSQNFCTAEVSVHDRMIFIPCILFSILILVYWFFFIYFGLKYTKKRTAINYQASSSEKNNERNRNSTKPAIENFDNDYPIVNQGKDFNKVQAIQIQQNEEKSLPMNSKLIRSSLNDKPNTIEMMHNMTHQHNINKQHLSLLEKPQIVIALQTLNQGNENLLNNNVNIRQSIDRRNKTSDFKISDLEET